MKKFSKIFFISFFLVLITDFFLGAYLLKLTPKKIEYTVSHKIFDHNLKKSFKSNLEWSPGKTYQFCTDKNSFRTFCNNINSDLKNFDIAFIGDSFTEGVGLNYRDTFVGRIANDFKKLKIANLGVVSYSPSIYYTKLKYLLENNYKFERVIIYFDISDIYDDNKKYNFENNKIFRKKSKTLSSFQKSLKSAFPFLAYSTKALKNKISYKQKSVKKCGYLDYCHEKSSWTFNNEFFGADEINKSLDFMEMTYNLLDKNNIKMSVGIYPWPAQIIFDNRQSKIVNLMSNFCKNKCEFFFNNFPDFFDELNLYDKERLISKYYIKGDVHFNSSGNEKIYRNFIRIFEN